MNEFDNLQTHLEQLETGTPLAELLPAMPAEEAGLLQLAHGLRALDIPAPDAQRMASQRAALLRLADDQHTPTAVSPPWWQTLFGWLGANKPAVAVVGALALLLLVWGLATRSPEPAGLAQQPGALPDAAAPVSAPPASAAAGAPAAPAEPEAIAAAPTPAYGLFLPAVGVAAVPDAASVGLQAPVGLVEVETLEGTWTAVSRATVLRAGQRVRTGRLSSARLLFYDGSYTQLGPNTDMRLDTVDARRPAAGFRTVVLTLLQGDSEHQVQFRNDAGSRYEVKTLTGSGIARGTRFEAHVGANGEARFAVSEGRVDVSSANRTVQVRAGALTAFTTDEPPADPVFRTTGEGLVSQVGAVWIIAGQPFAVDAHTVLVGSPQMGDRVRVEGHLQPDGPPLADRITLLRPADDDRFRLSGTIDEMETAVWIVAGQTISLTADTFVDEGLAVGDRVRVSGLVLPAGGLLAETIIRLDGPAAFPFAFTGVVQTMAADSWTISGVAVAITADTAIDPGIAVGDLVFVEGLIQADGTWQAAQIRQRDPEQAYFALTGEVDSIDPWVVAGVAIDVRPWSLVDDDIVVGDRVRVRGIIAADGTWIAAEIVRLDDEEDGLLRIAFVGVVDSIEPWIVDGLPLVVNGSTVVDPGIAVGDWVRVTAVVRADGTWLAQRIMRLDVVVDPGCVTVTALVLAINGDEIVLGNDQRLTLGEDVVIDGDLQVGSIILIVACANADGTITIVSITVLYTPDDDPAPPPPPPPGGDGGSVTICHKPGTPAEKTMTVPESALGGHLGHGDTRGACP